MDDELALHSCMAVVTREATVEAKGPGPVGVKFERGHATSRHPPHYAVLVDSEAIGNIFAPYCDLDQVVLGYLDMVWRVAEVSGDDGEVGPVRLPFLGQYLMGKRASQWEHARTEQQQSGLASGERQPLLLDDRCCRCHFGLQQHLSTEPNLAGRIDVDDLHEQLLPFL